MKWLKNAFLLYYDGFRNMRVGKSLWLIILIKLFIMFAIFKIFFFENYLKENFDSDTDRSIHVLEEITE